MYTGSQLRQLKTAVTLYGWFSNDERRILIYNVWKYVKKPGCIFDIENIVLFDTIIKKADGNRLFSLHGTRGLHRA